MNGRTNKPEEHAGQNPRQRPEANATPIGKQLEQLGTPVDKGVPEVEVVKGQDKYRHSGPTDKPGQGSGQQFTAARFRGLHALQLDVSGNNRAHHQRNPEQGEITKAQYRMDEDAPVKADRHADQRYQNQREDTEAPPLSDLGPFLIGHRSTKTAGCGRP